MASQKTVANLYNPHELSKDQLIENFVVRHDIFSKLLSEIKKSSMKYPEQHYLIVGQRGMGKTTLLLRLVYEIENNPELNTWLIPIILKEEAHYGITHLFNLWETVAQTLEDRDESFTSLYSQMDNSIKKSNDYERTCFEILVKTLKKQSKKIILFIDNMGEMFQNFDDTECHRLREILMTCPDLRIIGASTVVLEASFKYQHAFYEFFRTEKLLGLSKEETEILLLQLAKTFHEEKTIKRIIQDQPGRVEALRILTGGVIRTIILLFEIFVDYNSGNSINDLETVLDRVTPLYKHRMDDLTSSQRVIVNAIALSWDAIGPEYIAYKTHLRIDEVNKLLGDLEKNFMVQRVATDSQINFYQLRERFFNIWYLMRLAPKSSQMRVIWLVRFLESWYDKDQLTKRAKKHIQALTKGVFDPKAAYYLTEALSRTSKLDMDIENKLISTTKKYLKKMDKSLVRELSKSDKELFEEAYKFYRKNAFKKALSQLSKIKNKTGDVCFRIGHIYQKLKNYQKAEDYYLLAEDKGNINALVNLGYLYWKILGIYKQAEKYYLMAVEKGSDIVLSQIGVFYATQLKDYVKAEKYLLLGVEKGNPNAMFNLGYFYHNELHDHQNAEKYYLMAIENGETDAMILIGDLYKNDFNDNTKAEKYYLMASEAENDVIHQLVSLYEEELKDYKAAQKYYLRFAENGNVHALYHLGLLFHYHLKDYKKAEEYYLQAISNKYKGEYILTEIGNLYSINLKEFEKAENYYLMAAKKRNAEAIFRLGVLYHNEFKDYEKAEKYLLMATKKDNAQAMHLLGKLYEDELKDYKKAEKYLLMAANKGETNAVHSLAHFYSDVKGDYERAEKYFKFAIDSGDDEACFCLAKLYHEDLKEYESAENYYLMASKKGAEYGLNNLAWMLCELKIRKEDALKYILQSIEQVGENIYNRYNLAWIYLWHNHIEKALKLLDQILVDKEMIEEFPKQYSRFIMLLFAKKQYQYVAEYFEQPELNLKEKFKPLYYSFLYITGDKNYYKIPPELSETVQQIIEQVKQMETDYA